MWQYCFIYFLKIFIIKVAHELRVLWPILHSGNVNAAFPECSLEYALHFPGVFSRTCTSYSRSVLEIVHVAHSLRVRVAPCMLYTM